jgi:hypothetical protein
MTFVGEKPIPGFPESHSNSAGLDPNLRLVIPPKISNPPGAPGRKTVRAKNKKPPTIKIHPSEGWEI